MKAYITLDYELFMGTEVGTIDNCLIKPMNALTKMLDKYNIKCNIFVDAAYLLRLFQLKGNKTIDDDFQLVTRHIQSLSMRGHAIQFHFHPQWLYSKYEDGWIMDFEHYKIADMPIEDIKTLIPQAIELLQSYSKNKLKAFRAGGFSFPDTPIFYDILRKYGIDVDTSVLSGAKVKSKYQSYNYTKIPAYSPYCFNDNICVDDKDGYFTEYPISSVAMSGLRYFMIKYILSKRFDAQPNICKYGDGLGIGVPGGIYKRIIYKFKRLVTRSVIYAAIDGFLSLYLEKIYSYTIKNKRNTFVIIGHPKILSDNSIRIFERFINNHRGLEFLLFEQ